MNTYQQELVKEHSELIIRTQNLHNYIYSKESGEDDRVEFANKCIQLASMKKYEEALRARLENAGIIFEDGVYLQPVATTTTGIIATQMPSAGFDYDADSLKQPE